MNSASLIYVQEINNFLDTVVVKFEPFVTVFNEKLEYSHIPGYDEYDLKTAPYYRILAGDTESENWRDVAESHSVVTKYNP